jgi:hypothetical protein
MMIPSLHPKLSSCPDPVLPSVRPRNSEDNVDSVLSKQYFYEALVAIALAGDDVSKTLIAGNITRMEK